MGISINNGISTVTASGRKPPAEEGEPVAAQALITFASPPTEMVRATAEIVFTGQPTAGQSITVGLKVFTFHASENTGIKVQIDTVLGYAGTASNLRDHINADSDSRCTVGTIVTPGTLPLTAMHQGETGNSAVLSTNASNVSVTPFAGGTDANILYVGDLAFEYGSNIPADEDYAANTAAAINTDTETTYCTAVDNEDETITLTANTPGSAGNSITLSTTSSSAIVVTPFSGGSD